MQPMLPVSYAPGKVSYPAYIQPHMRGIRTLYQSGAFQSEHSWSAKINKIAESLKHIFPEKVILDGVIVGEDFAVFDLVAFKVPFKDRFDSVVQVLRDSRNYHQVKIIPTHKVTSNKEADDSFNLWLNEGYTGMIYRIDDCHYTKPTTKNPNNRSKQMLLRKAR
jgi:hypothetical protein